MKKLVVLFVVLLVSGCASVPYQPYAREVKKKPREGGVIALRSEHRPEDRARADFLMSANCGDASASIAEEGEVVVGEKTNTSANKYQEPEAQSGFRIGGIGFASGARAGENTNVESQTSQVKEWQISYQCVANAPVSVPSAGKKPISRK